MDLGKQSRAGWPLTSVVVLAVAFDVSASACYLSHTRPDLLPSTGGHAWSGTGRVRNGASSGAPQQVLGLAGREAWWSPAFVSHDAPGPLDAGLPLPAAYVLTGITQRISAALLQETWLHAQITGRTDTLTLFRGTGPQAAYGFVPIEAAAEAGIVESGQTFKIVRVCDLAGVDNASGDLNTDRLYMSVVACAPSGDCAGGLAEVTEKLAHWSVRILPGGAQQATMRSLDHARFPADCMPIAATGGNDPFDAQFVAIASPVGSDFLIFRAGAMEAGATGAQRIVKPGYRPVDLVILRKDVSTAALVVLWKSDARAVLEAYKIANGSLAASPVLPPYDVTPTALFVESPGWATGTNRELFLFAPEGISSTTVDLGGL